MPKKKFTSKEKNQILKKVLKKTQQNYENALRKKESAEMESFLEEAFSDQKKSSARKKLPPKKS